MFHGFQGPTLTFGIGSSKAPAGEDPGIFFHPEGERGPPARRANRRQGDLRVLPRHDAMRRSRSRRPRAIRRLGRSLRKMTATLSTPVVVSPSCLTHISQRIPPHTTKGAGLPAPFVISCFRSV